MRRGTATYIIAILLAALLTGGCSPKKNTAATRRYQAFITRYNIHYNGDTHYRETLEQMERDYADDYSQILFMHPAEARAESKAPQPSGSFKRSTEKAQKAIQLRSIKRRPRRQPGHGNDPAYREWLKREEYNPFLHNSWMMLAKSQYMDGEFLPAAATFHYIATHFRWLPATVAEARLWQARSYCAAGWVNEAEATANRVREKDLIDSNLRGLKAFVDADIAVRRGNWSAAIAPLRTAIASSKGAQKTRLTYLLGQVCSRAGLTAEAREAFRKAGSSSAVPYRTRLNARVAMSATLAGSSSEVIGKELKALRRMKRYDRNSEYLDQINYAEGNLLIELGDTAAAMHSYAEAAEKSTRRGIDMALARLALGRLYFDRGRYDEAQPCYAEAVPLLPDDYPDLSQIRRRSDVLDDLARYARAVELNDSLLRLADMPEAERIAVVDEIIRRLIEKEKEEADEQRRQEQEALAEANAAMQQDAAGQANAPTAFTLNTDKSWYFYNPTTRSAGSAQFRKRWGNRKLEDNWRRRDRTSYAPLEDTEPTDDGSAPSDSIDSTGESQQADTPAASDPHSREYYLKDIPTDEKSRQAAHETIMDGLYNMGLILKDRLEDFSAARAQWNRLLADYPDNVHRLDVYHNLYLMAAQSGDDADAERYRLLIVGDFPESPEGVAMTDPRYLDNLREMHERQEQLYADTWQAYLADRNDSVRAAATYATEHYPMSTILPKFMFLEALTHVTDGDTDGFTSALRTIVDRYPDTDVAELAATWVRSAAEGRAIVSDGTNARGLIWATRLTASADSAASSATAADTIAVTLAADAPRVVLITFDTDSLNPNEVLYEVARHNFTTYSVADFDLESLRFGHLGIIVVSTFDNLEDAARYSSRIAGALGESVTPAVIAEADWKALLISGGSLDDYFRQMQRLTDQSVHESVLPPSVYPTAEEMYDAGETAPPDEDGDMENPNQPTE